MQVLHNIIQRHHEYASVRWLVDTDLQVGYIGIRAEQFQTKGATEQTKAQKGAKVHKVRKMWHLSRYWYVNVLFVCDISGMYGKLDDMVFRCLNRLKAS